jgi:hypothetical protein
MIEVYMSFGDPSISLPCVIQRACLLDHSSTAEHHEGHCHEALVEKYYLSPICVFFKVSVLSLCTRCVCSSSRRSLPLFLSPTYCTSTDYKKVIHIPGLNNTLRSHIYTPSARLLIVMKDQTPPNSRRLRLRRAINSPYRPVLRYEHDVSFWVKMRDVVLTLNSRHQFTVNLSQSLVNRMHI